MFKETEAGLVIVGKKFLEFQCLEIGRLICITAAKNIGRTGINLSVLTLQ